MAAVEDVKTAVGEHQRPRQPGEALRQFGRWADLFFESRGRICSGALERAGFVRHVMLPSFRPAESPQSMYSNTLITLRTPPVVRAISTASSASLCLTRPSR